MNTAMPADDSLGTDYLSITEYDIPPLTEQEGVPFWEKEWITPELKALLFDQPDPETWLNTYLVVDATLRKQIVGFFDLDMLDIPVRCLFTGNAAKELEEVAPYLVNMTLSDEVLNNTEKIPQFHRDFFENHWDKGTGIIIRSGVTMNELHHHLRKFTRLQVEEDQRWVYFRFWEPRNVPSYFTSIKKISDKVIQWMSIREAGSIESIVANVVQGHQAWKVTPMWKQLENITLKGNPLLSSSEINAFKQHQRQQWVEELIEYMKVKDPFHAQAIGDNGLRKVVHLGIERAARYRLNQRSAVKLYIHLILYLGSYFDTDPLLLWAQRVLTAEEFNDDQMRKVNVLRQGLIDHLKITCGKQGEYLQYFMRACQKQMKDKTPEILNEEIYQFIKNNYPEKYQVSGGEILHGLIDNTRRLCHQLGLHQGVSVLYLSCLRWVYGTNVIEDPLFPWLETVLKREQHAREKDALFLKVVKQFFNHVINYVERR